MPKFRKFQIFIISTTVILLGIYFVSPPILIAQWRSAHRLIALETDYFILIFNLGVADLLQELGALKVQIF